MDQEIKEGFEKLTQIVKETKTEVGSLAQIVKTNNQETKEEFETLAQIINKSFNGVEKRFNGIEEKMATKEDLGQQKEDLLDGIDNKLANLKGDLIVLMRKEDKKVVSLIELLLQKAVLTDKEARKLLSSEPFPQLRFRVQQG